MKTFKVNGYFKDDKSNFKNYIICELDCVPEGLKEEDIFFFGMNENTIKEMVNESDKHNNLLDFIITSYEIYKYKYICKYCGSDEIRKDAFAAWNEELQKFELSTIFDAKYCVKCEGETKTKVQYLKK